ncbi:MAG: hypothetical protein A3D33_06860 [Candidatus Rokubacteria bacterium RIFCSPHIGHO2_02_FULL_73_26]|nr:MAG: hypothetical protein A3D33_06860 [Candidatus Rokubacteria bacterium RIFCSPHIGHO2_02_FULL_73_26]
MTRALAWLRRWGVSFASLGGGLVTLFVFRRGLPHVAWIAGYLVLLWLLVAVVTQTRRALEASARRSRRLMVTAADYTIQTLYHGLLLFVLPAYWASATLTSVNAPFLGLLVALALVATFDPWYRALVQPRPWAGYLFFVVSIFASLNVALPLVGLPPLASLVASAFVAAVALTPVVRRARRGTWGLALRTTVAIGVVAATLAALGRAWVPPVPLFMADARLVWVTADLASLEPAPGAIRADELRRRGLEAHTAIYAPAGLGVPIEHVWRRAGEVVSVVPLSPIRGGRRGGYRTYSRKTGFPPDPVGAWTVDVRTASGQLIGRVRFRVVS